MESLSLEYLNEEEKKNLGRELELVQRRVNARAVIAAGRRWIRENKKFHDRCVMILGELAGGRYPQGWKGELDRHPFIKLIEVPRKPGNSLDGLVDFLGKYEFVSDVFHQYPFSLGVEAKFEGIPIFDVNILFEGPTIFTNFESGAKPK